MDYIKFIKSDAIKKYLYDINYKIESKEAIYLVYKSENLSIPIKHFIYDEIMYNMSDEYHLYGALKEFINFERAKYNDFVFRNSGKFSYELRNEDFLEKRFFDNYCSLYNDLLNNANKLICNEIAISKTNGTLNQIAILNKMLEIFEIDYLSNYDEKYNQLEKQFINKIQVELPMPFKVGDLVYIPNKVNTKPFKYNGLRYNTSFDTYTVYGLYDTYISDNTYDDLAEPDYLKLEYFVK